MKTLYVSDLDGTLLNSKAELTQNPIDTLNILIDKGLNFTIATARCMTSVELMKPVHLKLLSIQLNGVLLYYFREQRYISSIRIERTCVEKIIKILEKYKRSYTIYYFDGGVNMVNTGFANSYEENFFLTLTRNDYKTMQFMDRFDCNLHEEIIYFTLIGEYSDLLEPYNEICKIRGVKALLYQDNYSGLFFLEIFSHKAGKDRGAKRLKDIYKADRLVVFGDNLNDLDMFAVADKALATANGNAKVKRRADAVIPSNDSDGVAKYLRMSFLL